MQLKPHQVQSFKALYKEKFNIELTDQEALEKWLKIVSLMKIILLPNLEIRWKK